MKKEYNELFELYSEIESDKVTEIIRRTANNNGGSDNASHSGQKMEVDIKPHKLYQLHMPIREWTFSQILGLRKQEFEFLSYILALPRKEQLKIYNYNLTMIKHFNPAYYDSKMAKKLISLYTRLSVFCMIQMCIDFCVEVEMVLESLSLPIAENILSQIGRLDASHDKQN